jgi:hypothetical protein
MFFVTWYSEPAKSVLSSEQYNDLATAEAEAKRRSKDLAAQLDIPIGWHVENAHGARLALVWPTNKGEYRWLFMHGFSFSVGR